MQASYINFVQLNLWSRLIQGGINKNIYNTIIKMKNKKRGTEFRNLCGFRIFPPSAVFQCKESKQPSPSFHLFHTAESVGCLHSLSLGFILDQLPCKY